jgi:hypothetical protein
MRKGFCTFRIVIISWTVSEPDVRLQTENSSKDLKKFYYNELTQKLLWESEARNVR